MRDVEALAADFQARGFRVTPQRPLIYVDVDMSGLVLPIEQQRGLAVEGAEDLLRMLPDVRRRPAGVSHQKKAARQEEDRRV